MLPRRVRAVIFDMDGTLHDTEIVYSAATRHAVEAVGHTVTEAFCHSLIGIPSQEGDGMIREHFGSAFPFEDFKAHFSSRVQSALVGAVPLKPRARELVQAVAKSGLKLAVATSAVRQHAERHLERSGLLRHLPVLVTRDDVARGKPFPDLFLLAAERLGVDPGDCMAVEDSLNGVRAAHAAGMMTVMVPDLVQPTEEVRAMCAHVLPGLDGVEALLALQMLASGPQDLASPVAATAG